MGNIYSVGPNEAMVISGGFRQNSKKVVVGGWSFAWWYLTKVQRLPLEIFTLKPICNNAETINGVQITVNGVAQVKVMRDPTFLQNAAEQFLGKNITEIKNQVLQTLEGHLRAILGTLSVEEVYQDRVKFADEVRECASPDVGRMGLEIVSFTIKDVYDNVQYLSSLGRSQTAIVKRNADIGKALANRDAGIVEAECEKASMDVRYETINKTNYQTRSFNMARANFIKEVNAAKAQAELVYTLESAKLQQNIREEEMKIEIVKRKKEIEIEEQEIKRKEKDLFAKIKLPAQAEAYKVQVIAEGKKTQVLESAKASAEKVRLIGNAEAKSIEAIGKAEAEGMKMKANAFSKYGDQAIMALVLESLPQIAAEVAAPLSKTNEIVLLGGRDRTTTEVNKLLSQISPSVHALTGVNLSGCLAKIPGASQETEMSHILNTEMGKSKPNVGIVFAEHSSVNV